MLDSSWLRGGRIRVVPYGVLSTRKGATTDQQHAGPALDEDTVIVDPAGAHRIRTNRPNTSKAGGASGAIYEFLDNNRFDQKFVDKLDKPLKAAVGEYRRVPTIRWPQTKVVCIHALGPNFNDLHITDKAATQQLIK
eukprot:1515870-Heterocapsa_arctica.AAC.1